MRQYTTPEQTAKLIELGLIPKHIQEVSDTGKLLLECCGFSVGELIEMLPKSLKNPYNPPLAIECNKKWRVYYGVPEDYSWEWSIWFEEERKELIDALYDMLIKLKKKKVI